MADDKHIQKYKILVTEHLGDDGITMLEQAPDVELDVRIGLERDELLKLFPNYDAIITRSGTPMDKAAIDAAPRAKVIARAGVGVDNVDLQEASKRGIIVINAPTGNTLAATEQTIALMLSVMRGTPQAYGSLRSGEWDRKRFTGHQLNGKKLLIIGLGRIGTQVALRLRAFGMDIIAYDPYVSEKKMQEAGVQKVNDLAGGLSLADVVTIHVPITRETRGLLNEKMLRSMKLGAYLVNCARGGVVDEAACALLLKNGHLAGAAFDVFTQEPPTDDNPLLAPEIADKLVLTPHIGANTVEAQSEVAVIAVSNTLAALRGEEYGHAVNLPFMEQQLNYKQKNFLRLCRKMGILAARLGGDEESVITKCRVMLRGPFLRDDDTPSYKMRPYTVAVIKGLLEVTHGPEINYMVAPIIAQERGIAIEESTGEPETYRNSIEAVIESQNSSAGSFKIVGTITEEGRQHIVRVDDYWIDFAPQGQLLIFQNHDRPGVIGKICKLLGDSQVNIANFTLGRKGESGLALAVMEVDGVISDELLNALENDGDLIWATTVKFGEES